MADLTPNYNLTKPIDTESYDIEVPNTNMDIVDAEMKAISDVADDAATSTELAAVSAVVDTAASDAENAKDHSVGMITVDLSTGDYTISDADKYKRLIIVTVGSFLNSIIAPTDGKYSYIVLNQDNALPVIIKKSGGSGVMLLPSASEMVVYEGNDYVYASKCPNKNYLINGNFDIWQRGTSELGAGYNWEYGSADKWLNFLADNNADNVLSRQCFTVGQTDVPHNPPYFLRMVVNNAAPGTDGFIREEQRIENPLRFSKKTMTLSFWAKSDTTRHLGLSLYIKYDDGSGGYTFVTASDNKKIETVISWNKHTATFDIPDLSGEVLGDGSFLAVQLWSSAGTNYDVMLDSLGGQTGTFDIAQIKLEEGRQATPYIPRPITEEQMLCYRYYWQGQLYDTYALQYSSAGAAMYLSHFKHYVPMRVPPTATIITAPGYNNCSDLEIQSNIDTSLFFVNVTALGAYNASGGVYGLSADL